MTRANSGLARTLPWVASLVALVAIGTGLGLLESPERERNLRLDDRRRTELRDLARAIDLHWSRLGRLPQDLAGLESHDGRHLVTRDPISRQTYEYRPLTESSFELCADFSTAAQLPDQRAFWSHPAGPYCFEIAVEGVAREPVFGFPPAGV